MHAGHMSIARHEFQRLRTRTRAMARASIQWAVIGGVVASLWSLPQLTPLLETQGVLVWLSRGILASFVPALILSLAISISAESGTELAQHPGRFLLTLAIAATMSTAAIHGIDKLFPYNWPVSLPIRLLNWWLTVMVFGAVFGWSAVLSLRHREDQTRLALLLSRRSLLARQIAQSRLLAARAQIDPEMVARVLADVRQRYLADTEQASGLLDQLIAYLRLAMNRVREQHVSVDTELALVRSYLALRAAETGKQIDLLLDPENLSSVSSPLFLMARPMIDAAAITPATHMALRIELQKEASNQAVIFTLDLAQARIPESALEDLRTGLRALAVEGTALAELDILHHSLDSGVNRYVVKADIDASATDRPDCRG